MKNVFEVRLDLKLFPFQATELYELGHFSVTAESLHLCYRKEGTLKNNLSAKTTHKNQQINVASSCQCNVKIKFSI